MKKKILLIGYNFHPEPTGIGKYSGEMIYWLANHGYDCTVITAYPYYPHWKVQEPYYQNRYRFTTEVKEFASGGRAVIHRCPIYVPQAPSGVKRILLDVSFLITASLRLIPLLFGRKNDIVITVVPSFQLGIIGLLYKKIKSAKFLYHIQDMQIEAARDLGMIKSNSIINVLFKFEKYIFNQADYITSISEGMVARIQEKAKKPVELFPNWTDMSLFFPVADRGSLKEEFGFDRSDKIVLYSGAIGEKQGLEAILHAAKLFTDIKFVVCGSGPYKQNLIKMAEDWHLDNVLFFPLQPFEKFNAFLNIADVHLVIQKANASDLVMPSKLTTILAVGGLALITANKNSGLHSLVEKYNMGVLVDAENQTALNEGIRRSLSENTDRITENARNYAEKYLSIEMIMHSFEEYALT